MGVLTDSEDFVMFQVPANLFHKQSILVWGGMGTGMDADVDVFVRHGLYPTSDHHGVSSMKDNGQEFLVLPESPDYRPWYVAVVKNDPGPGFFVVKRAVEYRADITKQKFGFEHSLFSWPEPDQMRGIDEWHEDVKRSLKGFYSGYEGIAPLRTAKVWSNDDKCGGLLWRAEGCMSVLTEVEDDRAWCKIGGVRWGEMTPDALVNYTFAHEMGHCRFELEDEYAEDPDAGFPDLCGHSIMGKQQMRHSPCTDFTHARDPEGSTASSERSVWWNIAVQYGAQPVKTHDELDFREHSFAGAMKVEQANYWVVAPYPPPAPFGEPPEWPADQAACPPTWKWDSEHDRRGHPGLLLPERRRMSYRAASALLLLAVTSCGTPVEDGPDAGAVCEQTVDKVWTTLRSGSSAVESVELNIAGNKYGPNIDWIVSHLRAVNAQGQEVPLATEFLPSVGQDSTGPCHLPRGRQRLALADPARRPVRRRGRQLRARRRRGVPPLSRPGERAEAHAGEVDPAVRRVHGHNGPGVLLGSCDTRRATSFELGTHAGFRRRRHRLLLRR